MMCMLNGLRYSISSPSHVLDILFMMCCFCVFGQEELLIAGSIVCLKDHLGMQIERHRNKLMADFKASGDHQQEQGGLTMAIDESDEMLMFLGTCVDELRSLFTYTDCAYIKIYFQGQVDVSMTQVLKFMEHIMRFFYNFYKSH